MKENTDRFWIWVGTVVVDIGPVSVVHLYVDDKVKGLLVRLDGVMFGQGGKIFGPYGSTPQMHRSITTVIAEASREGAEEAISEQLRQGIQRIVAENEKPSNSPADDSGIADLEAGLRAAGFVTGADLEKRNQLRPKSNRQPIKAKAF